jgi:putative copper export protein
VLASGFGRLLGLRLAIALSVWAVLALESPWPILALGAGMALVDGASAHAIVGLPGAGLMLDAIHVAAMAIWVGGLAAFVFAPDRRFGRYAIGGLAVAIGSGLLLALAHLGSPAALVTTGYGRVLVVKAALIVGAVLVFTLPRWRGRVRVGAATLILAFAAVLISLPPPR